MAVVCSGLLSPPGTGGNQMQPASYGRPQAAPMGPAPKPARPSCRLTTTCWSLVARPQRVAEVRGAGPWKRPSPARRFAPSRTTHSSEGTMGLTTGNSPPVDPATFMQEPYRERTKTLARHWAEYGFGAPKITAVIYIVKLLFFYVLGGLLVATLTSGLDPLHPAAWWNEPIVYQKAVIWTVLLECLHLAGSWGPLAGHFKPMTGGLRYYARVNTIRLPPWPDKVPFTAGDRRTRLDVALYAALIVSLVVALALPGTADASVTLVPPAALYPVIALLIVLGLRDKVLFIAARGEQ